MTTGFCGLFHWYNNFNLGGSLIVICVCCSHPDSTAQFTDDAKSANHVVDSEIDGYIADFFGSHNVSNNRIYL